MVNFSTPGGFLDALNKMCPGRADGGADKILVSSRYIRGY
jgi:hypothetical protein